MKLFSSQLMTVAEKFRLPIGRLSQSPNFLITVMSRALKSLNVNVEGKCLGLKVLLFFFPSCSSFDRGNVRFWPEGLAMRHT